MRNWPRYSRGSFDAEEITRPLRKKIFFSVPLLRTQSVPVFCPRLSHWSRSPGSIVLRLPLTLMIGSEARASDYRLVAKWSAASGQKKWSVVSGQWLEDGQKVFPGHWPLATDHWPL